MSERERIFNVPTAIIVLIGLFLALHLIRAVLDPQSDLWLLLALSVIPARFDIGGAGLPGGDLATYTSPITYMFLHGDFMHLTVNSVWMLAFGSAIVNRIGTVPFLIFSALCGLGGVAAHLLGHWGDLTPMLGASAAISGQMAGAMRFFFGATSAGHLQDMRDNIRAVPRVSILDALQDRRFLLFLAVWVGINFVFGVGGGPANDGAQSIAWEAHIGGFLTGLLLFDWFDQKNSVNAKNDPM